MVQSPKCLAHKIQGLEAYALQPEMKKAPWALLKCRPAQTLKLSVLAVIHRTACTTEAIFLLIAHMCTALWTRFVLCMVVVLHSFHAVSPDINRRISFWWQNFWGGFSGSWHQTCERSGTWYFRHSYLWENLSTVLLTCLKTTSYQAVMHAVIGPATAKSQKVIWITKSRFCVKASRHQCCLKQSPTSQERWQDTQDGWLMSSLKMVTWCQMAFLKMINHDQLMMSPRVVPVVFYLISTICKHTACALLSMVWVVWCCFCVCWSFSPARSSSCQSNFLLVVKAANLSHARWSLVRPGLHHVRLHRWWLGGCTHCLFLVWFLQLQWIGKI